MTHFKQTCFCSGHPWIRDHNGVEVPIDIRILRSLKAYMLSSPLRQAALRVCTLI